MTNRLINNHMNMQMNGPIFFSVSRLRHVLLHSSRLANLLLLPPHPPYTNSTHWPDDSSKRQRLKYAWHGPESSTRTHTAVGGSGRVTQRYKSLFNNNNNKTSGTEAQKRKKKIVNHFFKSRERARVNVKLSG